MIQRAGSFFKKKDKKEKEKAKEEYEDKFAETLLKIAQLETEVIPELENKVILKDELLNQIYCDYMVLEEMIKKSGKELPTLKNRDKFEEIHKNHLESEKEKMERIKLEQEELKREEEKKRKEEEEKKRKEEEEEKKKQEEEQKKKQQEEEEKKKKELKENDQRQSSTIGAQENQEDLKEEKKLSRDGKL